MKLLPILLSLALQLSLSAADVQIIRLNPPPNVPAGKLLELTLSLLPPPGGKITGITVFVETEPAQAVPKAPSKALVASTNDIPLLKLEKLPKPEEWGIGRDFRLSLGSTERAYHSEAPGLALFVGRKF